MSKHTKIHDDEYRTIYAVPVTLREVEAEHVTIHGITGFSHTLPLDSNFGIDAEEHAEMLDDLKILRVTFGVEYKSESNSVEETYGLEAHSARLGRSAQWDDCINLRELQHAAGHIARGNWLSVKSALRSIAEAHTDVHAILTKARQPFDDWAKQVAAESAPGAVQTEG